MDELLNSMVSSLIGYWLLTIHHMFMFIMTYHALICDSSTYIYVLMIVSTIVFLQYYNKGCFMTRLERKYTKKDYSIVDPLIYLCFCKPTNKNRYYFTVGPCSCGLLWLIVKGIYML